MFRTLPLLLALAFLLLAGQTAAPAADPAIRWEKSYAQAVARSRKTRKPLLIEFYADWCGPCKKMAQTTLKNREVLKVASRYVAVKVDLDKARNLAKRFKVTSIPHAIIMWPNGKVVREAVGYQEAPDFRLFLLQGLPN